MKDLVKSMPHRHNASNWTRLAIRRASDGGLWAATYKAHTELGNRILNNLLMNNRSTYLYGFRIKSFKPLNKHV